MGTQIPSSWLCPRDSSHLCSCGFGRTLQARGERTVWRAVCCSCYHSHLPKYPLIVNQRGLFRGDIVDPMKNEQRFRLLLHYSSHAVPVLQRHKFLKPISVAKMLTQTNICPSWAVKCSIRWGMKAEEEIISRPTTSSQEWAGTVSALPRSEL